MYNEEESQQREAIKFLLETLEETTIQAKALEFAIKLLVPPERRKALIDTFSQ